MTVRFAFRSPSLSVEFRGSETFVTEQIDRVRAEIRRILGVPDAAAPAPSAAPAGPTGDRTAPLEEFYRRSTTREGRGALQDSILIFAHYVLTEQGKPEFSTEDLNFCFDLLNLRRPKSLANTLGILKRDRGWLAKGSRRGTYVLTARGRERAQALTSSASRE